MSISEKFASTTVVVVAAAIAIAIVRKKWGSRHPPYPPGPKGYSILGNVFDFPVNPIWEGFTRMARGSNTDVLHLDMMGSHIVVLSNSDVATELLERRSVAYSDRPRLPMVNELMECSWSFALMDYGNTWRIHRRLFHRFFNISAADQFDGEIDKAIKVFLNRLSESPERFLKHIHFCTGSLTLSIAYGVNIESENDKFYAASEEAMHAVDAALLPGNFLVDAFPSLKYVPEWFPGAGFKRFAKTAKMHIDNLANLPFQHVKESLKANTIATSSFVATCLEELPELAKNGVDEEAIRAVGATVFLGGEETTSSTIQWFFLAVTMHPEVVALAQQELDEVLGGERLPDFSDKPRLPYISALLKEVLRWGLPNPLGTPHQLREDDIYNEWFIPAGATIFYNLWAMFHDEAAYPDPFSFRPDRFLKDGQINPDVKDPEQLIFGWGRRICPGRHFALRFVFLTIARTLATFGVSTYLDENGNPIVPSRERTHGLVSNPLPFRSNINPRSAQALSLISGH